MKIGWILSTIDGDINAERLTFLLVARDILEEVDSHLLNIRRKVVSNINSEKVPALTFRPVKEVNRE